MLFFISLDTKALAEFQVLISLLASFASSRSDTYPDLNGT